MGQDIKARLGGVLALVAGAALFWYFILRPLQEAQAGAAEISYSLKAFLLVPFCAVFGIAFLLLGSRFEYRTPDHKNFTLAGWLVFGIAIVIAGAGWWWFQQQFTALGYSEAF